MALRKTLKTTTWLGVLALTTALSSPAFAQNGMMGGTGQSSAPPAQQTPTNPQTPPYGYGPGMMYGYGPGAMMYGYGPMMGNGYGPGGMPGYGPGYGAHMGPGYGYGYGMHGYGPGMMYGYGQGVGPGLNLNPKQREALRQQWQKQAGQQQQLRSQLYQDMNQMQSLMAQQNPDPQAVGKIYDRIAKTRRQMLINGVEMRNKFEHTLTPEQRTRWHRNGPWCPGNAYPDNDD
ncbi:Spy/CpxP family protein refolding chaperone [Salinisphaera hydrothermalis]|uniref:Signaling pathway modulator ZraP n=1 Tax=Salinisphaera hydrothermalis (strain C41B8) TaxID=1304275 RepID=A0A084INA2_SALHC|nr:periplasmic heavy metal sensor [Salinisphaera hydrothermalis]KEZ78186.1 hypothetical protein C41B8_06362 [Salinisphaera hydrothermalis C41B8]